MYHCGPTVYNYLHWKSPGLCTLHYAECLRLMDIVFIKSLILRTLDILQLTTMKGLGDDGEDKVEKMAKASNDPLSKS